MKEKIISAVLFGMGTSIAVPLINVDVNIGLINHQPSGYVEYPADSGNKLDLKDRLGIKGSTKPMARAKAEVAVIGVYAQYMPMAFRGDKTTTTTLTYGGTTFDANQTIKSDLKLDRYDVALYLNVPFVGFVTGGVLDLEVGLNGRFMNYEGSVTGKVTAGSITAEQTESAKGSLFIPMLYGGASINLGKVSVHAEVRGIKYKNSTYYDLTGELRISPFSLPGFAKFYAGLGYRTERVFLKEEFDTNADIQINSPFVNVGVSF